jgi:phosphatidylserine decarboxylase
VPPAAEEGVYLSAADGRVLEVSRFRKTYTVVGRPRVSVFLGLLDVHVNRSPP